jgi:glucose/arabinose dehydrogenase
MPRLHLSILSLFPLAIACLQFAAFGAPLPSSGIFSRTNLVAWCIVPFDAKKRGPEERAAMLEGLGIHRLAYDWRAEHIPTFDAEVAALQRHHIELTAWWFPAALNDEANAILDCLRRHRLNPQLWVTMGTEPEPDPKRLGEKLAGAVETLKPICAAAGALGSSVGLYNHLGWFGEPASQIAIIQRLRAAGHTNVGMVYNFHHGHAHIDRFPELLWLMQPYLLTINLNGMIFEGDQKGKKIIPLGTGDEELAMLRALRDSGYRGPVGVIGHTEDDAEWKLQQELNGLERLVPELDQPAVSRYLPRNERPTRPNPAPGTDAALPPSPQASLLPGPSEIIVVGQFGKALDARVRQLLTAGTFELRTPPLTIEARVRLGSAKDFNIIASSEAKSSPTHWELYTYTGTGELCFFAPGAVPSEIRSRTPVADGAWHHVAAQYGSDHVALFVDSQEVCRQPIQRRAEASRGNAQFAIGRLVEGGLVCDGYIESVRIRRGVRPVADIAKRLLAADDTTAAIWSFETHEDLESWGAFAATVPMSAAFRPLSIVAATVASANPSTPSTPSPDLTPAATASGARTVNRDEPWKQTEGDWVDDRWNQTTQGRWQAYYFSSPEGSVRKGLAVRLGDTATAGVAYDTATGQWRLAWTGGFLHFDPARFGLLNAPKPAGSIELTLSPKAAWKGGEFRWLGFALYEQRLILEYTVGDRLIRESPWATPVEGGTLFTRDFEFGVSDRVDAEALVLEGPSSKATQGQTGSQPFFGFATETGVRAVVLSPSAAAELVQVGLEGVRLRVPAAPQTVRLRLSTFVGSAAGLANLSTTLQTQPDPANLANRLIEARGESTPPLAVKGQLGNGRDAYAIDTIPVPYDNPWKALMFCSGVGFFDNGDAAVGTIHGDVWRVSGLNENLERVEWRRIASGLFQPLGLTMVSNQVVVLCRDHLTRLVDLNGDLATDYYESLSSLIETSSGGHDYVTSLCRDAAGNFYYVDPRGVHRISPDGRRQETLAAGFRNPNGMGVSADGKIITVAPQQGDWTPSSVIQEIKAGGWYGYGGPKASDSRPLGYDLPLCWIPHPVDNSSGSQVWANSDRFGPLSHQLIHLSWGRCTLLLTLRDVVDGTPQGAVVPLKGRLLSGPMRGEFSPRDGQLYVVGCQGWQTAAARDGSFQRVRWTGKKLPLPTFWTARPKQLVLRFNEPLDRGTVEDPGSYALEAWNYRYAAQYGSKDWSVRDPNHEGRDAWEVKAARLDTDGRTVILDIPDLQPVMQFGLKFNLDATDGTSAAGELYGTIHRLHAP